MIVSASAMGFAKPVIGRAFVRPVGSTHPTGLDQFLPDGQFAHGGHAQIARRVILSHHFCIAETPASAPHSRPSRLDTRDVRPIVTTR